MKPDPIINPKHYTLCSRRVTTRALVALRICFSFLWIRFTLHTQGLARYPDGCGGGRSSFDPRSSRCLLARRGGARVTQHELGWLTDSAAILTSERSSRHPPSRALRRASRLISTSFRSVVSSCYWVLVPWSHREAVVVHCVCQWLFTFSLWCSILFFPHSLICDNSPR